MALMTDQNRAQARWWMTTEGHDEEQDARQRGLRLAGVVSALWRAQEPLRQTYKSAWRLYSQRAIAGLGPRSYRGTSGFGIRRGKPFGLNLCKAVVDAYVAQITKDIPRSYFDVTDGDRKLRQRAKHLQSFVDGAKYEAKFDETRTQIVRSSGIFGQGIIKILEGNREGKASIELERKMPWLILADEQEGINGDPSSIYELMWVDRQELMDEYPDMAAKIRNSNSSAFLETEVQNHQSANLVDWVVVVEGYHKPRIPGPESEGGSGDGRRTVIVGDTVLSDDPYEWHRFPYEFCYVDEPILGMYSEGIPNDLSNIQFEINRCMLIISKSQRLACGHWMISDGSDINTNAIDDVIASQIVYTGVKPEYVVYPAVQNEVYEYLWALWQKGFEARGLSQMAAQSQIPQGLKSGTAIDTFADVASERFIPQYRQYQSWDMRVTEQILHLAEQISERDPDFQVKTTEQKRQKDSIKWAEAGLKTNEYNLKIKEINALGETVSQKLQTATDLTSAGFIDQDNAKRMLLDDGGMPDLAGYESLESSSINFVEFCAEKAIDDHKYIQPSEYVDSIPKAIAHMKQLYLKATMDEVSEESLGLLRQWMDDAAQLIPPPPPPAPPMPVLGAPGAPHPPAPGGPLALAPTLGPVPAPPMQ